MVAGKSAIMTSRMIREVVSDERTCGEEDMIYLSILTSIKLTTRFAAHIDDLRLGETDALGKMTVGRANI